MTLTTQENYNKSIVRGEILLVFYLWKVDFDRKRKKTCVDGIWKKNEEKEKVNRKKENGKNVKQN